ncbi:serine hydrolase domain-containing protein [Zhouia amylolytica]|uniref:Beta-lactamase n=1 Tax=Zhouia amylolytica AD3 TaxID=1286632 RepID=W2UMS0_9FLAO|nr:serine hydrolase domain-containing protein [Zhouia amylolytica]ETN94756.1 beta-lactamase [Zhouia amylolytica AD3]
MRTLILTIVVAVFLIGKVSKAQIKNQNFLEELRQEVQKAKIPGCAVVVIKNNEVVISESIGQADVAFSVPVDKQTIFSINSLAKIFAGTAIMQLKEAGKINLSDPVSRYLNDLPLSWQKITVRQLLSHTSGLPDIEDVENGGLIGGKGDEYAWDLVREKPIRSKPGEQFNYIATNYLLIQKLIERFGQMDYVEFLKKNQFDKIGISDQVVFGSSYDVVKNKSTTYMYYIKDKRTKEYVKVDELNEISEDLSPIVWADTGAFATADAITRWILALEKGEFISEKSRSEMWTPVSLNNGQYGGFGEVLNGYAYGWPVIRRSNHPAIAPIGGGRASLIVYPEDKLTIILLTNLTGSSPQKIIEKVAPHFWE